MARKAKAEVTASADSKPAAQGADAPLSDAEKASPVMRAIGKRLRNARKRLNRIADMEKLKAEGKALNPDQEETLKAKAGVVAIIDELEKITPLLKEAAAEEVKEGIDAADAKAKARAERKAQKEAEKAAAANATSSAEGADAEAPEQTAEAPAPTQEEEAADITANGHGNEDAAAPASSNDVNRLLTLLYFSQIFNDPNDYVQNMERGSCISYDQYVEQDGTLTEEDLHVIGKLGDHLLKRQIGKTISHSEALEECKKLAQVWLSEPDSQLPASIAQDVTVRQLTDKLGRILISGYFTIQPVPQTQESQEGEGIGAAASSRQLGGSEGDFRGLAVSQAESVLEPVQPQGSLPLQNGIQAPPAQQPPQPQQQQPGLPELLGASLGSSMPTQQIPQQFHGSMYTAGYNPGVFQPVQPVTAFEQAGMPAINFMSSSNLVTEAEPAAPQEQQPPAPPPGPQQQPPAPVVPPMPVAPPPTMNGNGDAQAAALTSGDAEVPPPQPQYGRRGGFNDRGGRGGRRGGRGGGPPPGGYQAGPDGQQQQGQYDSQGRGGRGGRGGYQGRGGYRGGRGRNEGRDGGRGRGGPPRGPAPGQQQQAQRPPQQQAQ